LNQVVVDCTYKASVGPSAQRSGLPTERNDNTSVMVAVVHYGKGASFEAPLAIWLPGQDSNLQPTG
jgi:hypothetical protein